MIMERKVFSQAPDSVLMWRAGLVNQEQSLANFMHSGDVPSQLGTGGRKEV